MNKPTQRKPAVYEQYCFTLWAEFPKDFTHFESAFGKAVKRAMNRLDFGVTHEFKDHGLVAKIVGLKEISPDSIQTLRATLLALAERWEGKNGIRFNPHNR